MDIKTVERIVEQELLNNIDSCIKYEEISVYQGINGCIEYIQQITGCDRVIAEEIIDKYEELKPSNETVDQYEAKIIRANIEIKQLLNKPKCPTCQSTNVQKIGMGERIASVTMLGVFSKKINKSFKCKNCGYTW